MLCFTPNPAIAEQALPTLEEMCSILPLLGASLWGYLFTGNLFEKGREIFLIRDRHFLSKTALRAMMPLLFLILVSSGISSLLASEYFVEIMLLALQVIASSIFCVTIISLFSYVGNTASVGFALSLFWTVLFYGAHLGWFFTLPAWLSPQEEFASPAHSITIALLATLLFLILYLCEKSRAGAK
jgi:hypothetical protein